MPFDAYEAPRLLADIDGAHARFALELAPGEFAHAASLRCAAHADFHAAVSAYLGGLKGVCTSGLRHAAMAIANPVAGDEVRMTNCHWQFSIAQMRERLGLDKLVVVNDFTALAMALPVTGLRPTDRHRDDQHQRRATRPRSRFFRSGCRIPSSLRNLSPIRWL